MWSNYCVFFIAAQCLEMNALLGDTVFDTLEMREYFRDEISHQSWELQSRLDGSRVVKLWSGDLSVSDEARSTAQVESGMRQVHIGLLPTHVRVVVAVVVLADTARVEVEAPVVAGVAVPVARWVALAVVLVVVVNHPPQDGAHGVVLVALPSLWAATALQCPVGFSALLKDK